MTTAVAPLVAVKSQFGAEFRRFGLDRNNNRSFPEFYKFLERLHRLDTVPFVVGYTDPDGDILPISNNENFERAIHVSKALLRVTIEKKDDFNSTPFSGLLRNNAKKSHRLGLFGSSSAQIQRRQLHNVISMPMADFRRVSSIIDVDLVPETHRRVRLLKNGDKPLGFYIKTLPSYKMTDNGPQKVENCIFISRVCPGGLAESTGLLAVGDEVLEVNGISVEGKSLDQVTDMMVANSSNLIITIKPANQHLTVKRHSRSATNTPSLGAVTSGARSSGSGGGRYVPRTSVARGAAPAGTSGAPSAVAAQRADAKAAAAPMNRFGSQPNLGPRGSGGPGSRPPVDGVVMRHAPRPDATHAPHPPVAASLSASFGAASSLPPDDDDDRVVHHS